MPNDDDSDEDEQEEFTEEEEQERQYGGYRELTSGTTLVVTVIAAIFLLVLTSFVGPWLGLSNIASWVGIVAAVLLVAVSALSIIKVNNPYEQTVVLRLGRFSRMVEAGLYYILPIVERGLRVDTRIMTTTFVAEQTLTKDNIPVDIDAVIFWKVEDAKKAVLNVKDFFGSINKASMTALRDGIGKTPLAGMITEREKLDEQLQKTIDAKAKNWGIDVDKVEIKEVRIPKELQDAMSRQAQAEQERQARLLLGDSEVQVAKKFEEAARVYQNNPEALHLRGMNMLYEGLKQTDTMIIVPSSALDTMGFGGLLGAANAPSIIRRRKPTKQT